MDYKQKYEQALENLKKIKAANKDNKELVDFIEYEYPEFKESEDKKIIKSFIRLVKAFYDVNFPTPEGFERKDMIAWLEKQGEPKLIFRVGDYIRNKKTKDRVLIEQIDIANKVYCYVSHDNAAEIHSDFRFSEQNDWEIIGQKIVKQKPTWSEEDDLNLNQAIHVCHQYGYFGVEFWLKCFRERMKNKQ